MKKRNLKNDWALFSYITAYIKPYLGILLLASRQFNTFAFKTLFN